MNTLQKTIIIILVVILIMGLIIGGFFLYQNKTFSKNDPNEVLLKYVEALSNKNYEKMYEYLTNESKKLISKEDFISRNKNIYEGIEASDIKISVTKVNKINNDKTQITYTTYMNTLAGKINFSNTVDFLKDENKKYYLNWSSKVIYPELEQDDKIRVNTIEAKRGQILDRNGVVLAGKGSASSVRIGSWKDRK